MNTYVNQIVEWMEETSVFMLTSIVMQIEYRTSFFIEELLNDKRYDRSHLPFDISKYDDDDDDDDFMD